VGGAILFTTEAQRSQRTAFFHRPLASLTQGRKDRNALQSHFFLALRANKNLLFFASLAIFEVQAFLNFEP